jgi:hypothetical protein
MRHMDPEERFDRFERQQEFLAASQAQHDARMAEISALLAETSRRTAENSSQIAENSSQIAANSGQIAANSASIAQLGDLTLRIGRVVEAQAGRMDELAERLNTLINVVERYFSNGRN